MPKMNVTVPHELSKDEALGRLKNLLGDMKAQYGDRISNLEEHWTDDGGTFSFKAMGFRIAGALKVSENEMRVDGDFPWAAKPFQGQVETAIRERAQRLLKP